MNDININTTKSLLLMVYIYSYNDETSIIFPNPSYTPNIIIIIIKLLLFSLLLLIIIKFSVS